MRQRRIIIVEDDEILGRALCNIVRREAEVARASTIAAAKRLVGTKQWDAVIVDVGLPDGSGLDFLSWLRDVGQHMPALVITGRHELTLANRAGLLDAQFAFKPDILMNVKSFVRRVRAMGDDPDANDRATTMTEAFCRRARMTPREVELVYLVVEGVPRSGLAARVGVSENTIKTRVRGLLEKAGLPNLDAVARAVLSAVAREPTPEDEATGLVARRT